MTLIVTEVTNKEDFKIAKTIRYQVFVQEQGFDLSVDIDGRDDEEHCRHFIGKDMEEDKYVAVARCFITPELRKAKIGRVAVLRECRGKNYGLALMQGIEGILASDCDTMVLSSQYDRRGFYEKCGYEYVDGEVYLEEGVKHCMMIKKLQL